MRKKYRSHIGVLLDILRAIEDDPEATITRIIMIANIPYTRLKGYLEKLEERGFIRKVKTGNKVILELTDEGRKFLMYLERLGKMLKDLGFPL